MVWTIDYADTAKGQLRKLDKPVARRIVDFMDERIAEADNPRQTGKALTGPLGGLWQGLSAALLNALLGVVAGAAGRHQQAVFTARAAALVRHASDRARHGLENRERAVGAQPTENDGNVRAYSRHFQEQHPHSIG